MFKREDTEMRVIVHRYNEQITGSNTNQEILQSAWRQRVSEKYIIGYVQGVTKRCRLSWLTNSALVLQVQRNAGGMGWGGGGLSQWVQMCTSRDMEPK
jgi:hypothetical protein